MKNAVFHRNKCSGTETSKRLAQVLAVKVLCDSVQLATAKLEVVMHTSLNKRKKKNPIQIVFIGHADS